MNKPAVIEIAPFKKTDSASEAQLVAASDALENHFLKGREGYISRILAKQDDANWMDIVFWQSMESAKKAMQEAMQSEHCVHYFSCMVMSDQENPEEAVAHLQPRKFYGQLAG